MPDIGTPSGLAPRLATALTALMLVGSTLMAIAHAGVRIPVFDAFGPGGDAVVAPAAAGFAVAAVLFAVTLLGLARGASWGWALGLVVHGLTLVAAAVPFRGLGSAVGIVLTGAALVALLSRPGRAAYVPR